MSPRSTDILRYEVRREISLIFDYQELGVKLVPTLVPVLGIILLVLVLLVLVLLIILVLLILVLLILVLCTLTNS